MDAVVKQLLNPIVQTGAFALCLILTGIIWWLIKKLLEREKATMLILSELIQRTNIIVTENTEAVRENSKLSNDSLKLQRDNQGMLIEALAKSNGVKK